MLSARDRRLVARLARAVAFAALALVPSSFAQAQDLLRQGKGPLQIDADNGIEWRRDEQTYVASGHAKAVRGDVTVTADRLVAHYRSGGQASDSNNPGTGNIYRVDAIGNVVIATPTERAVGDHAIYDLNKAVMVLTGSNLKLTTPSQTITARDSLEYWDQRKLAVARGNAIAVDKDRRVSADVLTAHVSQDAKGNASHISRIDAFGNVRVSTPTQIAQAAKGVYNADSQIATLVDRVRVTQGRNQLNGDYAEVNLNTGVSRMLSGQAAGTAGARVSALIVPSEGSPPDTGQDAAPRPARPRP